MTESQIVHSENDFAFETCGHTGPPRRVCDVCKTVRYAFMACSSRCLRSHQQAAHDPGLPADAAIRARCAQARRNGRSGDDWDRYARHRDRLMAAIPAELAGGTLCVLGAGKCDDLDLPRLARRFDVIHLVDLDGEAIERARDRQPGCVRDAIVIHGGVDLSGLLARLDEWGDAFPDDPTLHDAASSAAHAAVEALGGPFDVTLSTCVLSQLMLPFQNAWAAPEDTWSKLVGAAMAVHIGILARTTAPRGAASLVFDVLSCDELPELAALEERPCEGLQAAVDAGARAGTIVLQPDPAAVLAQISNSGAAALHPGPSLTSPWLWDIGTALRLVYALNFRRP